MCDIDCPFRHDVRTIEDREFATCHLVQILTGLAEQRCEVDRSACQVCCGSVLHDLATTNDVVSSLVLSALAQTTDNSEAKPSRLSALHDAAITAFVPDAETSPQLVGHAPRCDVVMFCPDSSPQCERAIRSILNQVSVFPVLHLFGHANAAALLEKFDRHVDVQIHETANVRSVSDAIQELVPQLKTQFVAIQAAYTVSHIDRLYSSVTAMHENGLEILACAAKTTGGIVMPQQPSTKYERCAPLSGLVIRRGTIVDMGGFSDRPDWDAEFLFRAAACHRRLGILAKPLVTETKPVTPSPLGPKPHYDTTSDSALRSAGRGFVQQNVTCDVVLPFIGKLDFVEEALESVLNQDRADVVVHLIDDAATKDTGAFLSRWKDHPQIRAYRNQRNIGQFASFNNVYPFLETDLIAVQDSDDVSLPHRLHISGNALRLSDADLFGGTTITFGDKEIVVPDNEMARHRTPAPELRASHYPSPAQSRYFLMNPSLMVRRSAFAELGGFADFRERLRNRTGLDTEFQIRALCAGARIVVSKDIIVKYRIHSSSATQDTISGWGTAPRNEVQQEIERRRRGYLKGIFDARSFGALNAHFGMTERI